MTNKIEVMGAYTASKRMPEAMEDHMEMEKWECVEHSGDSKVNKATTQWALITKSVMERSRTRQNQVKKMLKETQRVLQHSS